MQSNQIGSSQAKTQKCENTLAVSLPFHSFPTLMPLYTPHKIGKKTAISKRIFCMLFVENDVCTAYISKNFFSDTQTVPRSLYKASCHGQK